MGSVYSVIPVRIADKETIDWLIGNSNIPVDISLLRNGFIPEAENIFHLLKTIPDCGISENESDAFYEFSIEDKNNNSRWTNIIYSKTGGEMYFSKGDINLIKLITQTVAKEYGSFVLIDESFDIIDIYY